MSTVNCTSSGSVIGVDRARGRLRGSFLTYVELSSSDSEDEVDEHIVYEIESDQGEEPEQSDVEVIKYSLRSGRRSVRKRSPVDPLSEEDSDRTPVSRKRCRTTVNSQTRIDSVKAIVPPKVWLRIFSFSQPKFLAQARRVSKAFRTLIDDETVWRCARVHSLPEYPGPILDLKEWEMCNLYLGTGCMICHAPKIKKRYWPFRIRCCMDCLKKSTIKEGILKDMPNFKTWWLQCLIPGVLDSRGNWITSSTSPQIQCQKIFWRDDVKVLEKAGPCYNKISRAKLLQGLRDVKMIEEFEEKLSREKGKGVELVHRQRYTDIRERISRLNPPLTDEILYHIPAYHAAIKIKRPLTDRSWNILVKKLEAGREPAVEKIAEIEKASQGIRFTHLGRKATKAMKPWIDQFLALDGGTVGHGSEASFALRVLSYVRTRWFDQGGSRIPLSALRQLWDEKLNGLLCRPGIIFMCAFCDKKHGLSTIFDHITIEHSKEMGWTGAITGTLSSYWRNQEWPAELPILNFIKPPGAIEEGEYYQTRMIKALSKTKAFMMLPDSHRFFLWFNLSITSYSREYNQFPDITLFAIAANDLCKSSGDRMFKGSLRCGICNAHQSKKKKNPWVWTTLSQHFGSHNRYQNQWPQKLLMLPNKAEISNSCSIISDEKVRQQWIMLAKEVDEELERVLDDTTRLEKDEACLKSIREESDKGVKEKEKEEKEERKKEEKEKRKKKEGEKKEKEKEKAKEREREKRDKKEKEKKEEKEKEKKGEEKWKEEEEEEEEEEEKEKEKEKEKDKEKGRADDFQLLKRDRGGRRGESRTCDLRWLGWGRGENSREGVKEKESRAGDLQLLKQDRKEKCEEGVNEKGSQAVGLQLLKRDRETELLRIPKRGYEHEEDGGEKRLKAGTPPPIHERLVGSYKNIPVPRFFGISPQEITGISRAHGVSIGSTKVLPVDPVGMPPAILAITQETQGWTGVANSEPDRLSSIYVIKDRDRSPSVNMDIEELFADA